MKNTIKIDGQEHRVLNSYSCGPGQEPHTYDVAGGYVYKIANRWMVKWRGLHGPWVVTVEV